jgi:hypothetical protein
VRLVNVSAVADANYENEQFVVIDLEDDPVVARSYPPFDA